MGTTCNYLTKQHVSPSSHVVEVSTSFIPTVFSITVYDFKVLYNYLKFCKIYFTQVLPPHYWHLQRQGIISMIQEFENMCVTCNVTHKDCLSLALTLLPRTVADYCSRKTLLQVLVSYLQHAAAWKGLSAR
jgi:hypothetical protein